RLELRTEAEPCRLGAPARTPGAGVGGSARVGSPAMRLDVYHHLPPTDTSTSGKLDQVLAALATLGGKVSQLSDAVDAALTSEADEDARQAAALAAKDAIIAELQSQNSALASDLSTALADDAADQATIDAKQAEIDAQN